MNNTFVTKYKKIKVGKKQVKAIVIPLLNKNLIVLLGGRGYVMCGYLNLAVAERFKDVAIKIVAVSTVREALKSKVFACTTWAGKLGIYKGQSIKEALKIIA